MLQFREVRKYYSVTTLLGIQQYLTTGYIRHNHLNPKPMDLSIHHLQKTKHFMQQIHFIRLKLLKLIKG